MRMKRDSKIYELDIYPDYFYVYKIVVKYIGYQNIILSLPHTTCLNYSRRRVGKEGKEIKREYFKNLEFI